MKILSWYSILFSLFFSSQVLLSMQPTVEGDQRSRDVHAFVLNMRQTCDAGNHYALSVTEKGEPCYRSKKDFTKYVTLAEFNAVRAQQIRAASAGKSLAEVGRTQAIDSRLVVLPEDLQKLSAGRALRRTDKDTIVPGMNAPVIVIPMDKQDDLEVSPTNSPRRSPQQILKELHDQAEKNKKDGFSKK